MNFSYYYDKIKTNLSQSRRTKVKYKTIIFDLDGTLLNTLNDLAAAANYALAKNKLPLRTKDEIRMFVGNGIHKLVERSVPANSPKSIQNAVFHDLNTYYKQHCADNTHPYPGIIQLLQKLRELGCQTAIVSNKPDYGVQALAKQYFYGQLDAACGERTGIAKKPAPDMLLAIMQELHADKNSTVYVGDSDTDIETAFNAGVPCIGACWGFRGRKFLEEHGAELLADTVNDLLPLLK